MKRVSLIWRYLMGIVWLLICMNAGAQDRYFHFENIDIEKNFVKQINSMVQDDDGFIWVACWNGLFRYNGYEFKKYPVAPSKDGVVSQIFKDSSGMLWMQSQNNGLLQLDPRNGQWKRFLFNPYDSATLSGNTIHLREAKEDSRGKLWFQVHNYSRHQNRINVLNTKTGKTRRLDPKSYGMGTGDFREETDFYDAWTVAKDGKAWIASLNGIYSYDYATDRYVHYLGEKDSLRRKKVHIIYEAPSEPGILWMTSSNDKYPMIRFNTRDGRFTEFAHASYNIGVGNGRIIALYEDKSHRLWVYTSKGLSLFNRQTRTFHAYPHHRKPQMENRFESIREDSEGFLWITGNEGVAMFDPARGSYTWVEPTGGRHTAGKTPNYFFPTMQDRQGHLWFLTDQELSKLIRQPLQFRFQPKPSGFLEKKGDHGAEYHRPDGEEWYWVGRSTGLFKWDPVSNVYSQETVHRNISQGEPYPLIMGMCIDRNNILWGRSGPSLFSFNPATGHIAKYRNDPSDATTLNSELVSHVKEDHDGDLWIGTYDHGISRLDRKTGKFTSFPYNSIEEGKVSPTGLAHSMVEKIFEDRNHVLWVAAGGLNRFDPARQAFTAYTDSSIGLHGILSMYEDRKGNFWVGTLSGQLILFNRLTGKGRGFTPPPAILQDNIYQITEDAGGNLWLSTYNNLVRFDPNTETFKQISEQQGLAEKYAGSQILKEGNDFMLVARDGELARFNPMQLESRKSPPIVLIESVTYRPDGYIRDEKNTESLVPPRGKIEFAYGRNRLAISYAALHYDRPEYSSYTYTLEGYDKSWIQAGNERSVTYTNLPPGHYTFYVKASNADGVWNDTPVSILIVIHPPWWRTWWAFVIYALLAILLLRAVIMYRSRKLRRENRLLEERVDQRTSELNRSLVELKQTQRQLVQSEKMASLGELTAGIAHEIQNPLNFVNNFSEVSNELLDEMKQELVAGNYQPASEIADDIKENLAKITHHGKRADAIVKGMLQHSRSSTGQKEPTDINALCDEYLRLAYHGLRAKDKSFNARLVTAFDPAVGTVSVVTQDIGRVVLNILTNAFYAVNEKAKKHSGYEPVVSVRTERSGTNILVIVEDNGNGIPQKVIDKIFQPFFTTKPTGEGTGLGLSLSFDIVKAHGGELKVETKENEYTKFTIQIPINQ